MSKLRIGLVGAGNIGQTEHLKAYMNMKDVAEVVAVADINLKRAQEAAEKYGIPQAFGSVEDMLAGAQMDAVDVCVWNASHEPVSVAALRAGKHVICEKPMADSLASAQRLVDEVKKSGKIFMMAMVTRFGNDAMLLNEMIQKGELGHIYLAKTGYVRRRGTPIGWFTDKSKSGGGAVIDIGVHSIDMTWFLMGKPKPVRVSGRTASYIGDFQTKGVSRWEALDRGDGTFDTEDSAVAMVFFENDATMFVEASWAINGPEQHYTHLFGSKGGAQVKPLTVYGENAQRYLSDSTLRVLPNNPFEQELRHFVDCVQNGRQTSVPAEDGLVVQSILDGIYRSSKEGKEILL